MTQLAPLIVLIALAAAGFFINAVILLIALLIMLKIQKMDFNWLWLIGAALLATFLDGIPVVGHPLAIVSLLLNIYFMSKSEYIDTLFTVSVGYAVKFTLNLFLLTALMGDLRPDLKHKDMAAETDGPAPVAAAPARAATNATVAVAKAPSNPAVAARSAEKPVTKQSVPPAPATAPTAQSPAQSAPVDQAEDLSPDQVAQIVKNFSLKGIVPGNTSGAAPLAIINTGVRNYTMAPGDVVAMETAAGRYKVRCEKVTDKNVTLSIGGQPVNLTLPAEKALIVQ